MKQYDIMCPICGTLNRGLYLEETDGWMECEHCHTESQDGKFIREHARKVPLLTMEQLPRYLAQEAG